MILDYPGGPNVTTGFFTKERRRQERERFSVGFGDGGRGHKVRSASSLWKLEKTRNRFSSRVSRRTQPYQPILDF